MGPEKHKAVNCDGCNFYAAFFPGLLFFHEKYGLLKGKYRAILEQYFFSQLYRRLIGRPICNQRL